MQNCLPALSLNRMRATLRQKTTKTDMKTTISSVTFILISTFCLSQNPIQTDTTITKSIHSGESFELSFENSPGTGYVWYLPENYDSTILTIQLKKRELVEGYKPKGGKYIYTYVFTGLRNGTFFLEYSFGRPWLKEKLKICILKIIVE
jgi:predicted secreted protein